MSAAESDGRVGESAPTWKVVDGGLAWRGDWMSVQWLTDALNGPEHTDRIPETDVYALLQAIEAGLATLPALRHAASYRECQECGFEWFENDPHAPEVHRSNCSQAAVTGSNLYGEDTVTARPGDVIEGRCATCSGPLERRERDGWCSSCQVGWAYRSTGPKTGVLTMTMDVQSAVLNTSTGPIRMTNPRVQASREVKQ